MRTRFTGAIVAAVLALPPVVLAQSVRQSGAPAEAKPAPRLPDGKPDLSGVWAFDHGPGIGSFTTGRDEPQMLPWAEKLYKAARLARTRGRGEEDVFDPVHYCVTYGFPRVYSTAYPFELVHIPGRVLQLFEKNRQHRMIWTDGRGRPDAMGPMYMGHAVGKWEGDVLLVETIGLRGYPDVWLDTSSHPQTDALRVVERIRRLDHDTLEINLLFDDPKAYAKPWEAKKVFQLRPTWEILENHICDEHFQKDHLPHILGVIKELEEAVTAR
jgi:hypothetical protein